MKSILLFFFLCLIANNFYSQSKSKYIVPSFDLVYGNRILENPNNIFGLNNIENYKFGQPISYVGLNYTSIFEYSGKYTYKGFTIFTKTIPQTITINDSLKSKISGYNFSMSIIGFDLIPNTDNMDLLITGGISFGRYKLKGDVNLKNPYIGPFISFEPRIIIGNSSISLRTMYDYDISKNNWKKNNIFSKENPYSISSSRFNGFNCSIVFGWVLE